MSDELVLLTEADRMLAEATTLSALRDFRDEATALKAYASSRNLGVDAENLASEYILRAERRIGLELIRMAEAGERAGHGGYNSSNVADGHVAPPSLRVILNLSSDNRARDLARDWQGLARLDPDTFEDMLAAARFKSERIARHNFYRAAKLPIDNGREHSTDEDSDFLTFRAGAHGLLGWTVNDDGTGAPTRNGLLLLPNDELTQLAALIRELVRAYKEVQATRA